MSKEASFKDALLAELPRLRGFAVSICSNGDRADDLVQDTVVKAWTNMDSFTPGTSLRAWLFTILRNTYFSEYRKRAREVADVDGLFSAKLAVHGEQEGHLDLEDFKAALAKLSDEQREVLILIGASGFSYEEAAEICGCAVGTIKSRLNRARARLAELLDVGSADAFGPDREVAAVLASASGTLLVK